MEQQQPLTILETAASIVGSAVKVSRGLQRAIGEIQDVPSDVRVLCSAADSVKSPVCRLVRFLKHGAKCAWPNRWLEDVLVSINAIGEELQQVQKLVEEWEDGDDAGGNTDHFRNRQWHCNLEEVQRSSERLEEARGNLLVHFNTIAALTTAQNNQAILQAQEATVPVEIEFDERSSYCDNQAFSLVLQDVADQMASLQDAVQWMSRNDDHKPPRRLRIPSSQDLSVADIVTNAFSSRRRRSFDSMSSEASTVILSPLASLNRHSFLENREVRSTTSRRPSWAQDNPVNIAALGLRVGHMQRKYDELLIHWDHAQGRITYLESELHNSAGVSTSRSSPDAASGSSFTVTAQTLCQMNEEVEAREAVIAVLKAQNETANNMLNQRAVATVANSEDNTLTLKDLSKQLSKKTDQAARQQQEIELLKWRLEGEQSSLQEQMKINQLLADEIKLFKRKAEDVLPHKKEKCSRPLTPGPEECEEGVDEQHHWNDSLDHHDYRLSTNGPPVLSPPSPVSPKSSEVSFWQSPRLPEIVKHSARFFWLSRLSNRPVSGTAQRRTLV